MIDGENFTTKAEEKKSTKYTNEKYLYDVMSYWNYFQYKKNLRTKFDIPYLDQNRQLFPSRAYIGKEGNCAATRIVWSGINRVRSPTFAGKWLRDGIHLVTGSHNGELSLWNPIRFLLELNFSAHESAVRAISVSKDGNWFISAEHNGNVKYWQPNMNPVHSFLAHVDPIRDICYSPTDLKFATCGDDGLIKIWDFEKSKCDSALQGHGTDVKCLDWHPYKGLLVSGSKDCQQPIMLWDPRNTSSLCTIHSHKNSIMSVKWNCNGNYFASASKDKTVKVFDIRTMTELQTFRGHKKEVYNVSWHTIYDNLFSSGGVDGSIFHWIVGEHKELSVIDSAHDGVIWEINWHPEGHMFSSVSNDQSTKVWSRNLSQSVPQLSDDTYLPIGVTKTSQETDISKPVKEPLPPHLRLRSSKIPLQQPVKVGQFFTCVPIQDYNYNSNTENLTNLTQEQVKIEDEYFYNKNIPPQPVLPIDFSLYSHDKDYIPPVMFDKPRKILNYVAPDALLFINSFNPANQQNVQYNTQTYPPPPQIYDDRYNRPVGRIYSDNNG